jgi:hypothetical protein
MSGLPSTKTLMCCFALLRSPSTREGQSLSRFESQEKTRSGCSWWPRRMRPSRLHLRRLLLEAGTLPCRTSLRIWWSRSCRARTWRRPCWFGLLLCCTAASDWDPLSRLGPDWIARLNCYWVPLPNLAYLARTQDWDLRMWLRIS